MYYYIFKRKKIYIDIEIKTVRKLSYILYYLLLLLTHRSKFIICISFFYYSIFMYFFFKKLTLYDALQLNKLSKGRKSVKSNEQLVK